MKKIKSYASVFCVIIFFFLSCKKEEKTGFLSNNIQYPSKTMNAVVGANLVRSSPMSTDGSTLPIQFYIAAIKHEDGSLAQEVMNYTVDTYFWHQAYTGNEKDNAELDLKRELVNRPAIDINPLNGQIIIYPEANDTTKLVRGRYILDIGVRNSAQERIIPAALTININYAAAYFYNFLGVDGNLRSIETRFTRVNTVGNQIIVKILDNNNIPINPVNLLGYNYGTEEEVDLKDWTNLGLSNPTKYTVFNDRLALEVASFPIPFVAGRVITIDLYNNGNINGGYFNFWFDFAIYKEGIWNIDIKLNY